jgi:hypothetical protein
MEIRRFEMRPRHPSRRRHHSLADLGEGRAGKLNNFARIVSSFSLKALSRERGAK